MARGPRAAHAIFASLATTRKARRCPARQDRRPASRGLAVPPEGATDYLDADLRDPQTILSQAARTLDFSRPVAVMLIAIMHLIGDDADPYGIVRRLMAAVPAGSYLALSQVASDIQPEQMAEAARRYNRLAHETQRHRDRAEVTRFFDGLDLVEPGLVPVQQWRPGSEMEARARSAMWGGVARKR
jgi:S-adenosyl methyltransferase